jgi:hypothetical protein
MKPLKCLITIQDAVDNPSTWFGNGYSQNVKFFYDLLQLMGHEPWLLVANAREGQKLELFGREYRCVSYQEVFDQSLVADILFEVGVSVGLEFRNKLKETNRTPTVSTRYGISLVFDMEQIAHKETMSPGIHIAPSDMVWTSPHIAYGLPYLQTLYQCPGAVSPYIWEPDFLKRKFVDNGKEGVRDIYCMEPNMSVIKNAIVPLAIIEEVYRAAPDSFGKAMILNGLKFHSQKFFLENIVRNMSSLISHANKVFFTGRYKFDEVFKKPDVLIGHQWGCDLNYLYLQALYAGLPFVHNSDSLQDVGYYYPGFEVGIGREQLLRALREHDVARELPKYKAAVQRYSIHNPDVQAEYQRLLDQVMDLPR